jgi:hypothetical protein
MRIRLDMRYRLYACPLRGKVGSAYSSKQGQVRQGSHRHLLYLV